MGLSLYNLHFLANNASLYAIVGALVGFTVIAAIVVIAIRMKASSKNVNTKLEKQLHDIIDMEAFDEDPDFANDSRDPAGCDEDSYKKLERVKDVALLSPPTETELVTDDLPEEERPIFEKVNQSDESDDLKKYIDQD